MARNRSPWFSLGYLLAIAVIVLLLVLFVLWLAEVRLTLTSSLDSRLDRLGPEAYRDSEILQRVAWPDSRGRQVDRREEAESRRL